MSMLRNISNTAIQLQVFNTNTPYVADKAVSPVINLQPGEVIQEADILVVDPADPSYNLNIINEYIAKHILTRI